MCRKSRHDSTTTKTTGNRLIKRHKALIVLAFFSGCNQSQIIPRSECKNSDLFNMQKFRGRFYEREIFIHRNHLRNASAPAVISRISLVMAVWRALLYSNVSSERRSVALSVAWCMAVIRAPCSAARETSSDL